MSFDIKAINEKIQRESAFVDSLQTGDGQGDRRPEAMVERLLVGLLANGHILLEGVPGLAKTLARQDPGLGHPGEVPADPVHARPAPGRPRRDDDLQSEGRHRSRRRRGPIFANFILADEINRSPAKVQSALLEAMQERQVTIGEQTFKLPEPFLVLATQNPIEQEGTYPLPEAQVDRFMLKVKIGYPSKEEELLIMRANVDGTSGTVNDRGHRPRTSSGPAGWWGRSTWTRRSRSTSSTSSSRRGIPKQYNLTNLAAADQLRRLAARLDQPRARREGLSRSSSGAGT